MLTKCKVYAWGLLLTILFISCNNGKQEANTSDPGLNTKVTPLEKTNQIATGISDSLVKSLQGEWKEPEYPFRRAHFKNTTVKFTEEGVVEEPTFRAFKISQTCPFAVNNITNAGANDLFLVMAEARTCELLKVSNDTLTLSGFSTNTNSDYKIVYNKVQ